MSAPIFSSTAPEPTGKPVSLKEKLQPYLAPYYLTMAGALGAATVGFIVVVVLLILVAANFNVLGLIE